MQAVCGFFVFFVILMSEHRMEPSQVLFTEYGASYESYGYSGPIPFDMWFGTKFLTFDERQLALRRAQTGFLLSIIQVQWADLLICKTRSLSLFQQGMKNMVLWFGLFSETLLIVLLVYVPFLNTIFSTEELPFVYWLIALPWSLLIFWYDEIRKYIIRHRPDGFVKKNTYY